jgi:hypothetical protein
VSASATGDGGQSHTVHQLLRQLPEGKLLWTYRESKTRKFTSLKREPLEFMSRFLQHTLPRGFARVRTFGWLHPAAKVRANRVRALLHEKPLLTNAEKQTWNPPSEQTLQPPVLLHTGSSTVLAHRLRADGIIRRDKALAPVTLLAAAAVGAKASASQYFPQSFPRRSKSSEPAPRLRSTRECRQPSAALQVIYIPSLVRQRSR